MHKGSRVVFDEVLTNASSGLVLYTSIEHTEFLSTADQLVFQAVVQTASTIGRIALEVRIEQSANGRTWAPKHALPELSGTIALPIPGGTEASLTGAETWPPRPRLRFARLRLDVTMRAPLSTLHLVLHATARTRGRTKPPDVPVTDTHPTRRLAMATLLGVHPTTLAEVEEGLLRAGGPGEQAVEHVFGRLSAAAQADMLRLAHVARSLDPERKRVLLAFLGALSRLLLAPYPPAQAVTSEGGEV